MAEATEPEVLNARRAFPKAQALLAGEALSALPTELEVGWHDTSTHPEIGAFAAIGIDSGLDDWIGEIVLVTANARSCFVYVIGSADVPTPLSLARRAFCSLAVLSVEELPAIVEVIQ
jgi:hypothetical protein